MISPTLFETFYQFAKPFLVLGWLACVVGFFWATFTVTDKEKDE